MTATTGDPALAAAMAEVDEFAAVAGWNAPRRMFALVDTRELLAAEPGLAGSIDAAAELTPIAQDDLPGDGLADALAGISWPSEVLGCVLLVGIGTGSVADSAFDGTVTGGAEPETVSEGRLIVGVLRDRPGGACLLRWREHPDQPISDPRLAPGLVDALQATFED